MNAGYSSQRQRYGRASPYALTSGDFRCLHCSRLVAAHPQLSGVRNRNHCPHCLWSRHLDLYQAGDRLSACKSPMQPIGLALKHNRKKYPAKNGGELMLIHRCSACGKLSINRIAADDQNQELMALFESSLALDAPVRVQLSASGITALQQSQGAIVRARLFGRRNPDLHSAPPD